MIDWPAPSDKMADVGKAKVETFYLEYATAGATVEYKSALMKVLRTERVRWHPDRMQHKLGNLAKDVLVKFNEVFKIVKPMLEWYKEYT